jgi:hypothetical protein
MTHILSFLAGALFVLVLGGVTLEGLDHTATVVLSNETRGVLANVRVHNRQTGGTLVVDRSAPGQRESLRIHGRGEGSYVLLAELPEAGRIEAERYVESGYTITEHMAPDEVTPEHDFY